MAEGVVGFGATRYELRRLLGEPDDVSVPTRTRQTPMVWKYGEVEYHFGPDGHPLDTVRFPETDFAAIARGYGCEALTVRDVADLDGVAAWLAGPRSAPLLLDAKVTRDQPSWWLEEAFRGHLPHGLASGVRDHPAPGYEGLNVHRHSAA